MRSRVSWMNSLTSTAMTRSREKPFIGLPLSLRGAKRHGNPGSAGLLRCAHNDVRGRVHPSSEIVLGLAHQVDEHVLQRRLGLLPAEGRAAIGGESGFERGFIAAADVEREAEGRGHLHAGTLEQLVGAAVSRKSVV